MHRPTKLITFLIIVSSLMFLGIVAGGAYYMGLQRQKAEVEVLKNERAVILHQSTQNSENTNEELNKTTINYDTACLEYQKLYAEYETLYEKTDGSGMERYVAPDSARDNPESCYH